MSVDSARDQLMHFLSYIKPSMQSHNHFCNHKSAIATAFKRVLGFDLGKDAFITQWMKSLKNELPPQPDEDGWDVGFIVQYWSTQAEPNRRNKRTKTNGVAN